MQPRAIRKDAMVRGTDGLLRVEMVEAGREYVLDPFAELIWGLCDGSRSIEALTYAAGQACLRAVHREEVFSALDLLADAGLIAQRVVPPVAEANVSRRALLARIAPVVGVAAWMMSGISAKAGGLIQSNESSNKESSNKESGRKAQDRESNNKESGRKAQDTESNNKESGRKAQDTESNNKRDRDKQQDAEKGRKRDLQKTFDSINESERKRDLHLKSLEQRMRASSPKIYDIVGHKLSELPELLEKWQAARRSALGKQTLTRSNYEKLFQRTVRGFQFQVKLSKAAVARLENAGFTIPLDFNNFAPALAGDSQKKTYLVLEHVADPAIGNNWRYALSAGNLRLEFHDPEAAFQFLSNRRATDTQKPKAANR